MRVIEAFGERSSSDEEGALAITGLSLKEDRLLGLTPVVPTSILIALEEGGELGSVFEATYIHYDLVPTGIIARESI